MHRQTRLRSYYSQLACQRDQLLIEPPLEPGREPATLCERPMSLWQPYAYWAHFLMHDVSLLTRSWPRRCVSCKFDRYFLGAISMRYQAHGAPLEVSSLFSNNISRYVKLKCMPILRSTCHARPGQVAIILLSVGLSKRPAAGRASTGARSRACTTLWKTIEPLAAILGTSSDACGFSPHTFLC